MFALVKTPKENAIFKKLFLESQQKYNFKYNSVQANEERYLLLKSPVSESVTTHYHYEEKLEKCAIGTLEINPFEPNGYSIVQPYAKINLSKHPKIEGQEIFEIGKLYIQENYQNRGYFKNLLLVVHEHAERTDAKFYLAQMILPLFEVFRSQFENSVEQIGPPDDDLIPGITVLINIEKLKRNEKVIRLINRYMGVNV